MSEAEQFEETDDEQEPTVEELTEQLKGELKEIDFKRMIKEVQKQDSVIATAKENKKAAYAVLMKKGASKKGLQRIVEMQQKPEPENALVEATLRAYAEITGQEDLFNQ